MVTEGNAKGNWNNLGTTWIETLKKGDDVCLKVDSGTIDEFFAWWGVRIFANLQNLTEIRHLTCFVLCLRNKLRFLISETLLSFMFNVQNYFYFDKKKS